MASKKSTARVTPGPSWGSFEQFRKSGIASLEQITEHSVGLLQTKSGPFRILHDQDFQRLIGIASEVYRLQQGIKIVQNAARVLIKHPDMDHVQLLARTASMIVESHALPQHAEHCLFPRFGEDVATDETPEGGEDDFDLSKEDIPRPTW